MSKRPTLLFVSPRYLLPADSGGKIRTRDVMMGLKGGRFEVVLACPAAAAKLTADRGALEQLCDRLVTWPEPVRHRLFSLTRMRHLFSPLPIPVATDRWPPAVPVIAAELARRPHVVVVDFPHAGVLVPQFHGVPSVLFTHNVEAEIFRRHAEVARAPLQAFWRDQARKMERFERHELARYDAVIAVAERDRAYFESHFHVTRAEVIPTGVNLALYSFAAPAASPEPQVVFSGSMDWLANIDAIEFFMAEVWPRVAAAQPRARFTVIGRSPPARLVEAARQSGHRWTFTGFVEDVRPYIRAAQACVIPLRVAGGTRLKVYEAMAMGCPVVSTAIGVEGLPLTAGTHYELADAPEAFAAALIRLLEKPERGRELAAAARSHVERHSSHLAVARVFEEICARAAGVTPGSLAGR